MIEGFEQYTDELNDTERQILPVFVEALGKHIGKANAISNKQMRLAMEQKLNITISDARIRKIVQVIRQSGMLLHLVSTSKGYYIADDHDDLVRGIAGILSRANSIRDTAIAMMQNENVTWDEIKEYYQGFYFDGEDPAESEHP